MVIADECHHVSSNRFEDVMSTANAQYVYGLTATPTRQDGRHPIIFQQCGPIRYRVDAKEQAIARGFSHTLVPRFTRFRRPLSLGDGPWPITDIYTVLTENKPRNDQMLRDLDIALERGRTPMILTERVTHAKMLAERIKERNLAIEVFLLIGEGAAKDKRERLDALRNKPDNQPFVIVATGKYVGEGFDEPRLDTLFITMPIAWKGTVTQYAGRLHRLCEGKDEVIVYDYVDIHVPVLERMYHKRLAAYASLGYSTQASPIENEARIGAIYNQQSFFPVFAHDAEHAQKEILIVSPYLSKGRVFQMKKPLVPAILNGARVAVVTRPAEAFSPETQTKVAALIGELENGGVKVILKDNIHQKFAVIDYRIVWYGSINFLSYGKSEESVMRFENEDVAGELLEGLE
jgi:superfamily II DNA or RNA helicase